jgi:UDP-glucose 4-epimerase
MTVSLVTGAAGFIGQHLVRYLADAGHTVVGLGRIAVEPEHQKMEELADWEAGDVDASRLSRLTESNGPPHYIFHLAGGASVGASLADPYADMKDGVLSTACLLEWVRHNNATSRVVMVSSAAVYGDGHEGLINEECQTHPHSPYGFNKSMAELCCRSYALNFGIPVVIVRLFSVYGPGLRKQLVWDACRRLQRQADVLTFAGTGQESRDWIHVHDAVRLLDLVKDHSGRACPIINGGTSERRRISEVVSEIVEAWGERREVVFTGDNRPGDPKSLIADVSLARSLGFVPAVEFRDGIRATVNWFKRDAGLA